MEITPALRLLASSMAFTVRMEYFGKLMRDQNIACPDPHQLLKNFAGTVGPYHMDLIK
ncbi:MAG: hypothetical protein ACLSHW_10955 [Lachnospiraceae bacterium]